MRTLIPVLTVLVTLTSTLADNSGQKAFDEITDILTKVNTYVYGFYKFGHGLKIFQSYLGSMNQENLMEFRDLLKFHYGPRMSKIEQKIQGKLYDDWMEKAIMDNKLKAEYGEMLAYLFGVAGENLPEVPRKRIYESDITSLEGMKYAKSLKYMVEYRTRFLEVYGPILGSTLPNNTNASPNKEVNHHYPEGVWQIYTEIREMLDKLSYVHGFPSYHYTGGYLGDSGVFPSFDDLKKIKKTYQKAFEKVLEKIDFMDLKVGYTYVETSLGGLSERVIGYYLNVTRGQQAENYHIYGYKEEDIFDWSRKEADMLRHWNTAEELRAQEERFLEVHGSVLKATGYGDKSVDQ